MPYLPEEYTWVYEHVAAAFVDQEGGIMDMQYALCPRCKSKASNTHWITGPGGCWFRCPECDTLYDEPEWNEVEVAYLGMIEDEDWTGWGPVVKPT